MLYFGKGAIGAKAKYQVSKAKIFSSLFECEPHHMISVKDIKDWTLGQFLCRFDGAGDVYCILYTVLYIYIYIRYLLCKT